MKGSKGRPLPAQSFSFAIARYLKSGNWPGAAQLAQFLLNNFHRIDQMDLMLANRVMDAFHRSLMVSEAISWFQLVEQLPELKGNPTFHSNLLDIYSGNSSQLLLFFSFSFSSYLCHRPSHSSLLHHLLPSPHTSVILLLTSIKTRIWRRPLK